MRALQEKIKNEICALLKDGYDFDRSELTFSQPAERKFGDLSTTLAFSLAKQTKSKPFLVAGDMAARLAGKTGGGGRDPGCRRRIPEFLPAPR